MFNFKLGNVNVNPYQVKTEIEDFFVSGKHFGGSDQECFLGIFPYDTGDQDTWFLGSVFMKKYYSVFDLTPYTDRGESHNQILLGTPAANNPIDNYHKDNSDQSSSTDGVDSKNTNTKHNQQTKTTTIVIWVLVVLTSLGVLVCVTITCCLVSRKKDINLTL